MIYADLKAGQTVTVHWDDGHVFDARIVGFEIDKTGEKIELRFDGTPPGFNP